MWTADDAAADLAQYAALQRRYSAHYYRDMERRGAEWRIRLKDHRPFVRIIWLEVIT